MRCILNGKYKVFITIGILLMLMLILCGCTEKEVYEGKFISIKYNDDDIWELESHYWKGIFETDNGKILEVHGNTLKYIQCGIYMRVFFEYLGGWQIVFYEYLEEPTYKKI
jgi:hypothetical protein